MKVWIDGRVVGASDARIPVTDHGLLYGDGLFEGLRVAGRGVFRLADHLDRLGSGARAIGLALPGGKAKLATVVLETARAYDREQAYLRLIVTRGDGALGVDPISCKEPVESNCFPLRSASGASTWLPPANDVRPPTCSTPG